MNTSLSSSERIKQAKKVTWVGLWVNLTLSILKLITGILGRSSAMFADGVHSISDFLTDALVIVGFNFTSKPIDESHDYGHGKFETLSSAAIGFVLLGVGIGILWTGTSKILVSLQGEFLPVPGWSAFVAAAVSILANESLYWYQKIVGERIRSQAVIANAWHHRSDSLTSVAALLGIGGAIMLGEKWVILDPIAAVLVSILIIKVAFSILKESLSELTEASLGKEARSRIMQIADTIPEIQNAHHVQTRRIGSYAGINLHIEVDKSLNIVEAHNISHKLEDAIKLEFGEESLINIHIEPLGSRRNKPL